MSTPGLDRNLSNTRLDKLIKSGKILYNLI